ncbi:hypothetical protein CYK00_11670 [Neisseria sicca]|uniref:Uncharacterized protein n=1 Tax=Neisseria sicca TaxID=490 RepID=A0A2I1X9B9_NEISI|nr:hypothetical protein CYK00_11670 [Neisseria sicca]
MVSIKGRLKTFQTTFYSKFPIKNIFLVIPAQAGIQTCPHRNLLDKTVSLTLRSGSPPARE